MARVPAHPARATRRRPHRVAGLGASVIFSLTLASGIVAPGVAEAAPTRTAPGQVPNGSNGVNHNDPPPTTPQCTSGPCTTAQPLSTADKTNNGANTTSATNPYASTRHGLPSDNGSGNGQATGRPCAGCVGKADNKNPQGQAPNGPSDHNNGYECDGNNGIGQTNPAHTGCTGTTTTGGGTGGGGGGSCSPTTANNNCGTGTGPGESCTPTSANHDCGTGTGPGGSCTPTAANHDCGTSPGGDGACTPTTAGCAPSACSAPRPSPEACAPAAVLAIEGSRLPSAPAPEAALPAALAADGLAAAPAPAPAASPAPPAVIVSRVLGESGARSLPYTGVDLDTLLLAAGGLLMGGATTRALGRRPRGRGARSNYVRTAAGSVR